jgi:hypothetical protein
VSPLSSLELSALAVRLVTVDGRRVDDPPPARPATPAPGQRAPAHRVFEVLRSVVAELRAANPDTSPSRSAP